jgi:hypothetical protein
MKTKSYLTFSVTDQNCDIIFAELREPVRVDITVARDLVADRLSFTENRKHYLIADISNVKGISAEAKEFLQRPEGGLKNILGAALIASNPVSALIANIFIKTRANFQTRFFSDRKDAMEWINENRLKSIVSQ